MSYVVHLTWYNEVNIGSPNPYSLYLKLSSV